MPTVTATPVKAYAHCRDARCPGYNQQEVDAVREEASYTFGELGGDGVFTHMQERSSVEWKFADVEDAPCPVCSELREVTGSHRPSYQPLSGHDPLGLLSAPKFDAAAAAVPAEIRGESDGEIEARLRVKLKEEAIEARLRAELES